MTRPSVLLTIGRYALAAAVAFALGTGFGRYTSPAQQAVREFHQGISKLQALCRENP